METPISYLLKILWLAMRVLQHVNQTAASQISKCCCENEMAEWGGSMFTTLYTVENRPDKRERERETILSALDHLYLHNIIYYIIHRYPKNPFNI